eukprot:366245-Chlamydomonas_euryale.AAC.29
MSVPWCICTMVLPFNGHLSGTEGKSVANATEGTPFSLGGSSSAHAEHPYSSFAQPTRDERSESDLSLPKDRTRLLWDRNTALGTLRQRSKSAQNALTPLSGHSLHSSGRPPCVTTRPLALHMCMSCADKTVHLCLFFPVPTAIPLYRCTAAALYRYKAAVDSERLWQAAEFGEVWRTLVQIGLPPLVALLCLVEKQRGVASQLLDACVASGCRPGNEHFRRLAWSDNGRVLSCRSGLN